MEEEKKSFIKKETIIAAIIGLLIGVVAMFLLGWSLDYIAKSGGIAKLRFGDETIATVSGKSISTDTIYNQAKKSDLLGYVINEVDKIILNDKYDLTEKEEKEVLKEAEYYISSYETVGYTKEQFLKDYGFESYEAFLQDIRVNTKYTKYLYDYLESLLEEGAVQKYYDENKENIETYDTEHILVKISDEVKDEDALALANEIISKLNEGKTFSEIVEEYGDKVLYEELGYYGKTASLEQTYIDEMVALEDGAYSQNPVKTSYGYHIVHKIATATIEDLRGSIIEILSEEILTADENITYKAFVELRKENNFAIHDEELNTQYEEYCNTLYGIEE